MKKILYLAIGAGMLMGAGCRKQEDGSTEVMTPEEVVDKSHEASVQTTETTELAAKAEETTKQVAEKTRAAVSALTVKAEEVMGDLNQSVEQIKEKVAGFDKNQLLAYVDQYKILILEKKDQIAALSEQIKTIPLTDMMGDKAKALKEQLGNYTEQLNALKDRYGVYLGKLKEYGVDLSPYGL